ncbi:hypothetical protein PHMEG_00030909, partial [Phytophthora megakarya]
LDDVRLAQQDNRRLKPSDAERNTSGLLEVKGKLWLSEEAEDLVRRVMIVAHCGSQGHRGLESMLLSIGAVFFVRDVSKLCRLFLARCLLCKHTKGGNIVPRPWGPTYQATRRNEMLHYDFLYMGDSADQTQYILVLKDGLSHFCELVACDSPTSSIAAQALLDWSKRFGAPDMLMSDTGSHFKNLLVNELCQRLQVEQHFVVAYSPWINGSVERINRDILQVVRVMLMELQLNTREWVYLLPVIQANLNHTPVSSLNNRAPSELFTLLPVPNPLKSVVVPRPRKDIVLDVVSGLDNVESLRESLHSMHKEVVERKEARRRQNQRNSSGTPCNFTEGDFVLWSRIDSRLSNNKLLVRWVGPFEVTKALPHSFKVRHLVTNKIYNVHGSRLKFFADSSLDVTEELIAHVGNQGMVLEIEEFKAHRFVKTRKEWQLLVSWDGLQAEENSWESLTAMAKEVPVKVSEYIGGTSDSAIKTEFAAILARHPRRG